MLKSRFFASSSSSIISAVATPASSNAAAAAVTCCSSVLFLITSMRFQSFGQRGQTGAKPSFSPPAAPGFATGESQAGHWRRHRDHHFIDLPEDEQLRQQQRGGGAGGFDGEFDDDFGSMMRKRQERQEQFEEEGKWHEHATPSSSSSSTTAGDKATTKTRPTQSSAEAEAQASIPLMKGGRKVSRFQQYQQKQKERKEKLRKEVAEAEAATRKLRREQEGVEEEEEGGGEGGEGGEGGKKKKKKPRQQVYDDIHARTLESEFKKLPVTETQFGWRKRTLEHDEVPGGKQQHNAENDEKEFSYFEDPERPDIEKQFHLDYKIRRRDAKVLFEHTKGHGAEFTEDLNKYEPVHAPRTQVTSRPLPYWVRFLAHPTIIFQTAPKKTEEQLREEAELEIHEDDDLETKKRKYYTKIEREEKISFDEANEILWNAARHCLAGSLLFMAFFGLFG